MTNANDLRNWLKSLPNKLTLARIAVIPVLVLLYPFNVSFINFFCAVVFAAAAMTDFFDGYLARKYGTTSRLGAILDPIADKLLTTAALILLTNSGRLPAIMVTLLLCRDIAVNGLRLMAAEQTMAVPVSNLGKVKSAVLDLAIFCLMFDYGNLRTGGIVAIWISLVLSYYSGYLYWHEFWKKANFGPDPLTSDEPRAS
jgi:CDP-diacylglycerol--glycerol-3-phosphate 3-phosphatidyltransferase